MSTSVTGGDTNVAKYFQLRLSADGKAAIGITVTTLDMQYTRSLAAAATKVDAIVGTGGAATHVDNKIFEIDATSSPGLYMACFPDAAFAAGVPEVILTIKGSTIFSTSMAVAIDPPVNVTKVSGDSAAADNLELDYDGTGYTKTNSEVGLLSATQTSIDAIETDTGTTLQGELDAIQAAVITNAAGVDIAADIIAVKAETASIIGDTAAIVIDTATVLQGELDAIQAAVITNAAGVDIAADIIALKAETAAILDDTGTTIPGTITTVDTVVDGIQADLSNATDGLGAIKTAVDAVPTTAMRGTNDAALAAVCTESRLAELDASNLPTDVSAVKSDTAAIKLKTDNQPEGIQKNATLNNFEILMVDSTDHVTPKTGLTVTGQRSVDGGAFTNVAGTIAEVGSGIYQFDALAPDTNGDLITWKFNGGATADDAFVTFKTVT